MERSHHRRWRHTRDTIPARRRRRRTHRRDTKRGGTYYPMQVEPGSAQKGIRMRLIGAVVAASTTLLCIIYAMLSSIGTFGATFALAVGLCSFGAAVGLVLSARHEEEVHQLAARFADLALVEGEADPGNTSRPAALPEPDALADGQIFEDDDILERPEMRGVARKSYSQHTDGLI